MSIWWRLITTSTTLVGVVHAGQPMVFTFAPYVPVGSMPDCTIPVLDNFKLQLGLTSDYPDSRLINQFMSAGLQKLLQISAKTKLIPSMPTPAPPESYVITPSIAGDSVLISDVGSSLAESKERTSVGVNDSKGLKSTSKFPDFAKGFNGIESEIISVPNPMQPSKISSNQLLTFKPRSHNFGNIEAGGIARSLEGVNISRTNDLQEKDESLDDQMMGIWDQQEQVTRRQLQSVDTILENIFGKSMTLLAANLGTKPSSQSLQDTNTLLIQATDDLRLTRFLNSVFVGTLADQLVNKVSLNFGLQTIVNAGSPMINLGSAVCSSALAATDRDPVYAVNDTCAVATILRDTLACNAAEEMSTYSLSTCDENRYSSYLAACDAYNQDPQDPNFILDLNIDEQVLNSQQGNIDRWLFNAANVLYTYAKSSSVCGDTPLESVPFLPGWAAIAYTQMDQSFSSEGRVIPISVLLQKKHIDPTKGTCDFAIINRGTQTLADWVLDFQTEQTPLEVKHKMLGQAHSGFTNMASPAAAYFSNIIESVCPAAENDNVTVVLSGHSMGGGVSKVAALLLTEWLPHARIAQIGFASPQALDTIAQNIFTNKVVSRTWTNAFDAVPKMPCQGDFGMVRCNQLVGIYDIAAQYSGFHNVNDQRPRDVYGADPGEIEISVAELGRVLPGFTSATFGNVTIDLKSRSASFQDFNVPGPLMLSQAHSDAYKCWLDSNYCFTSVRICR